MRKMVDIRPRLDSPEVRELVNQLEYPLSIREAKTTQILAEYRENPDQPILGVESEGELLALIGLRRITATAAVIRHIVVRRDCRNQGVGREMIGDICRRFSLSDLTAETDRDAVEFYRKVGFDIQSLGEKYPGTERFACRLTTEVQPANGTLRY
jgi:ribosomal protein S18 acetylase RimI-like enzyme